jgi:predicted secreted protein
VKKNPEKKFVWYINIRNNSVIFSNQKYFKPQW